MDEELSSVTTARVSATGGAPHDTGRQPGAEPDQVPEEPHSLRRADGLHRDGWVSIASRRGSGSPKMLACNKKRVTLLVMKKRFQIILLFLAFKMYL